MLCIRSTILLPESVIGAGRVAGDIRRVGKVGSKSDSCLHPLHRVTRTLHYMYLGSKPGYEYLRRYIHSIDLGWLAGLRHPPTAECGHDAGNFWLHEVSVLVSTIDTAMKTPHSVVSMLKARTSRWQRLEVAVIHAYRTSMCVCVQGRVSVACSVWPTRVPFLRQFRTGWCLSSSRTPAAGASKSRVRVKSMAWLCEAKSLVAFIRPRRNCVYSCASLMVLYPCAALPFPAHMPKLRAQGPDASPPLPTPHLTSPPLHVSSL